MGRKYKNPPIIEAICEFRFEPGQPWDLTIPGMLYEKMRTHFPLRRQASAFQFSIGTKPEDSEAHVEPAGRMQFFREDEKALVQVARDLLVVNHLKPYPTWQEFLPLANQALDAYRHVANPKGLRRIGLRYINRVEIPGPRMELEHHFHFRPFLGPDLPENFASFIVGIEIPYEDSRDRLRVQLSTAAAQMPDTVSIVLDLDYFLSKPGEAPLETALDWLDIAHGRLEAIFEACITDRLREMFQEVAP